MSTNEDEARRGLLKKEKNRLLEGASLPAGVATSSSPRVSLVIAGDDNADQNLSLYIDEQNQEKPVLIRDFETVQLNEDQPQKLQLNPQIESKLKAHIPLGYQLKCTANNSDSWWEATAQALNQLIGNDKIFSVKSLRSLVSDIVVSKRPDWLTADFLLYDQDEAFYLARISETVAQMKERNQRGTLDGEAIPGSEIEAKVLCTQFPINIHWIEINDQGEIKEKLTTAEGTEEIEYLDKKDYDNNINMIHLVVANDHIVPLINLQKTPSTDTVLLTAMQDIGGTTKQKLDRSKRLSVPPGQSLAVKCLTEIFESEKKYHENLRQFALTKIPGKKAKIKKTSWQRILSWLPSEDDSDKDNYNVLRTHWPEIRQNALAAGLKKVVAYLDDFVSNYTNPEMAEIEIVYSMDTVYKVKKSWRQIQDCLLQNQVMTIEKLKDMNQFIQQSVDDNLPGGWVRIRQILDENRLNIADVIIRFEPFISGYNLLAKDPHAFSIIDHLALNELGHLEQQKYTDENLAEWVNIIYQSIIGDEKELTIRDNLTNKETKYKKQGNTFINNIFPKMVALKEYYYFMLKDQSTLMEHLTSVKENVSNEDKAYFRESVAGYLNSCLIKIPQRIGKYESLIKELQKALPHDHPAQKQLLEISQRFKQLNIMANELPKTLAGNDKIDSNKYKFDRPYSEYSLGNNFAAISYMAKLGSLINCWHYNKLGRDIIIPRQEKLNGEFKIAETEFKLAEQAWKRVKDDRKVAEVLRTQATARYTTAKQNFETASKNNYELNRIRARIWERKQLEEKYVNEFQNFLQQLFIDSRQYFNDPITSRIDTKIDVIVSKIGSPESIFANSLINLKRQFRNPIEAQRLAQPSFPLDLFDNCFCGNMQALLNPTPPTQPISSKHSSASHADKAPLLDESQRKPPARITSQSSEAERNNAKLAQHYMRLTIIDRVKTFFQKFDQQTQDAFFKSASDSIQRVSYRIQQGLDELSKLTVKEFEDEYKLRPDKEIIGEIIIKIIKPHLAVTGLLKDSYLTGSFGQMLDETTRYLNIINQTNKTPREMFIHNYLPIKDSNSVPPTTDDRPAHKKIVAFYANMQIIADYYCGNGLGLQIAQRAGGVANDQFGHLDIIKRLALLAERMILDPRSEAFAKDANEVQAKELLKEMLGRLKTQIIDSHPGYNSRSYNELVHLYNYFAQDTGLAQLKTRDDRRFKNFQSIVDYQISTQDAHNYLNKHIAEKYARVVLDYSHKIDSRFFIETAVCKEEAHNEILKIINEIYEMSVVACKIEIDKLFDKLPKGQKNISYLIHHRIHEYVNKALSSKLIYQQGQFGKMLLRLNAVHEEMNPGASNQLILAVGSLSNERQPQTPLVARAVHRSMTSSKPEQNFIAAKSPAKTPAKTPRRNTALSQYTASHNNRANELPAKKSLILLVAQLLALSHYYRNTEIGEEIRSKLQIPANVNQQGQKEIAKELANFALELFLEDEADNQQVSNQNSRNIESDLQQRNLRAQERWNRLLEKMVVDINKIRGDSSLIQNITHSPDSRFAKALEELLPLDRQKGKKRNILNPLHFTTAKNTEFLSTTPKQFIHHVVIEQSYRQFEKLEESLMGSIKKKAGDPQQIATNQIHQELKKLAALPLSSCESEITKLGYGKNIRDLVFSKASDAIVRSGKIAECIFDGPLGGKLLKIANLLFNTQYSDTHGSFLQKIFTPNQVRRYPNVSQERSSIERTKLHVCGRLLMLSDYYLDTPLGRQVADKGAREGTASYNVSKKGWAAEAEKIRAIATGLYFGKYKDEEAKSAIRDVLNHIKLIIYQIRSSGSAGLHSRFVNELIRIVKDYGNDHDLKIATDEEIDEHYLFNNAAQMFDTRIGTDNFEDFTHMSVMQSYAAAELVKLKNEINSQRWTCVADKESLEIAEKNLDELYKKGLKERRALIKALPHGQQDIGYLIREKLQNRIPYPFWSMNPQGGQIQKAIQKIKQNLNDIKQPHTSPIVSSMRIPSRVR